MIGPARHRRIACDEKLTRVRRTTDIPVIAVSPRDVRASGRGWAEASMKPGSATNIAPSREAPHAVPRLTDRPQGFWTRGWEWLNGRANRGLLRILLYHGVCADEHEGEPWVPSHYVTQKALDAQLAALRRAGTVIDLREGVALLRSGRRWNETLFAVTFDDAPANLLTRAAPVLAAHGVTATIFACTDRLEDGGLLDEDARQALYGLAGRRATAPGSGPIEVGRIDPQVRDDLRCMRWDEALAMALMGHWLGAHTRAHVRLSQADPARRMAEIAGSVNALRRRLKTTAVPFAYPYGQSDDFGAEDLNLLRALEVPAVCTARPGANAPGGDPLCLRRTAVGLYHRPTRFALEMTGLLDARRRRQAARRSPDRGPEDIASRMVQIASEGTDARPE